MPGFISRAPARVPGRCLLCLALSLLSSQSLLLKAWRAGHDQFQVGARSGGGGSRFAVSLPGLSVDLVGRLAAGVVVGAVRFNYPNGEAMHSTRVWDDVAKQAPLTWPIQQFGFPSLLYLALYRNCRNPSKQFNVLWIFFSLYSSKHLALRPMSCVGSVDVKVL
jgi:hypothetical protein